MKKDTKQTTRQIGQVKVLGDKYKIIEDSNIREDFSGYCGMYSGEIRVRPVEELLDSDSAIEDKEACYRELLRHEIVHAFFNSSGLDDYCSDEVLVQWLAVMAPLIHKAFVKAGCEKR